MKILIAVVTCHAYRYLGYHTDTPGGGRAQVIRETWKTLVPEGVDFKFFYGRGEGIPKDDEVFLDVSDAFFAMPGKIQAVFKYAVERGYDYILECTDDTWINVPVALQSDFAKYDYVGNARNLGNSKVPFTFVSGFAVWYSRRAMEIVANTPWADYDKEFNKAEYEKLDNVGKVKWHDDLWVGSILSAHGIVAHDDERYLIEIFDDIGNGPPSTYPKDRACAIHLRQQFEFMRALMPKPVDLTIKDGITMVLTSCDRHGLLRRTLDSFIRWADIPLNETVIVEDSPMPRPNWLTDGYSPKLGKIVWLQNSRRMGQIYSIDRAYAEVKTNHIFHCEDDWLFIRGDFMGKSKDILDSCPQISTVVLSDLPREKTPRYPFPTVTCICSPQSNHLHCGRGLCFNPGLRRLSDYQKTGGCYKDLCVSPAPEAEILRRKAEQQRGSNAHLATGSLHSPEADVSKAYIKLGFSVAHLGYPCVRHIGDFDSTFREECLGLIPAKVSIVMTTFNRPNQLRSTLESIYRQAFKDFEVIVVDDGNDTETQDICWSFGATHIKLNRPSSVQYRNPSLPINVGIRQAKGDIIILQNAECKHVDPHAIEKLSGMVTGGNAVFAKVTSLNPNGTQGVIYCNKEERPRPYFFCGAIKRAWFEKLRGFDEDYTGAGYDDDDFGDRLRKENVALEFSDVEVHHQWHPPAGMGATSFAPMEAVYKQKTAAMSAGTLGTVRNLNRDWGSLKKNNVLIAVVTCKKYADRAQALRDTWVPQARAAGYDVEFFDGERLGVPDDYMNLPLKAKAIFKWTQEHQYGEMLKVDDDTYIQVSHLHPVNADYAGNHCDANDWGKPNNGVPHFPKGTFPFDYITGGAVWFSKKAIQLLADTPLNGDFADDRWVGQVMANAGIRPTTLPDFYWHPFRVPLGDDFAAFTALPSVEAIRSLHVKMMTLPPPCPPPPPPPDVKAARCNRHNVAACSVCIAHGWQFRQPIDPVPVPQPTDPTPAPVSPQATTPPAPPPQPHPQVQQSAAKALTATLKPSQGALYRNRNAGNRRKIG